MHARSPWMERTPSRSKLGSCPRARCKTYGYGLAWMRIIIVAVRIAKSKANKEVAGTLVRCLAVLPESSIYVPLQPTFRACTQLDVLFVAVEATISGKIDI